MAKDILTDDAVASAMALHPWGKPLARKRGRNPKFPYVPVVDYGKHTHQLRKRAFVTADQARDYAAQAIERNKAGFEQRLRDPRYRALRVQHGLPAEIEAST